MERARACTLVRMRTFNIIRSVPVVALVGMLGVALMGAASPGDSHFSTTSMHVMLQSIADAEAVRPDASGAVKSLAADVQKDELAMGNQLVSIATYYGINLSTTMPKATATPATFAASQSKALSTLVGLFKDESENGGGGQLRAYATEALPILQKDLAAAKAAH